MPAAPAPTPRSPLPDGLNEPTAIVIGAGFYGARLALRLRQLGHEVLVLEREPQILGRASVFNQARVHNGYHYPRSILTSLRSRVNYSRFREEYHDCVFDEFTHYYAIARGSKVTASQFTEFCRRVGASLAPAPDAVRAMFDRHRIEQVFTVTECAFDAARLRERMLGELIDAGVELRLRAEVCGVTGYDDYDGGLEVSWRESGTVESARARLVLNCTYSGINGVLTASGLPSIPLKGELTEMALIEPPPELDGVGVTVMDGPFFSLMPYPPRPGLYTLSHVRYTPHCEWQDHPEATPVSGDELRGAYRTRFAHMVRDAARYLPVIAGATYADSIWELKALMPRSEQDDSRPILFRPSDALPGLVSVLGGKIDSVYDVEARLLDHLAPIPGDDREHRHLHLDRRPAGG